MVSIFGETSVKSQYEKFLHDLKYEGVFPPPTVFSPNTITPNIYYLTYDDGEPRHCLLRLHDLDGEQCLNIGFNNTALKFKYLYLCVGADEMLFSGNNGQQYYKKILSRVLQNLTVIRRLVSMISSIGNAPDKGNTFSQSQYEPFCIDMPIARILADLGMCKIAVEEDNTEAPKEERVSGLGGNRNKNGTSEKSFFRRFKEKILIHDEDDDEEFEDDTYGEYTR